MIPTATAPATYPPLTELLISNVYERPAGVIQSRHGFAARPLDDCGMAELARVVDYALDHREGRCQNPIDNGDAWWLSLCAPTNGIR